MGVMHPAPDLALAEITDELATARLDVFEVLTVATGILSRTKQGTWVAMVMNEDPTTSRIVTSDDADPAMATYIDAYVSTLDRPGRTPTTGISRRVIETGAPILVPSMPFDELFSMTTPAARQYFDEHPVPREIQSVGVAAVPMHAGDVTIGTLALIDWDSRLGLDDDMVAWMQVVADRIAVSVEHVQCHSAARRRLQRLNAIRNVGLALASSDDPRLTMQVILEQLSGRFKVDAADILLVDEHNQELYPAASIGFHSGSAPDFRIPISAESVDLSRHLRHRPGFAREGFQHHEALPLRSRGKLLGVMEVFYRSATEVDRESTDFLESTAAIAAIAIDNLGMDAQLKRVGDAGAVRPAASPKPRLSEVEWRIVALLSDGATNRDIAAQLHLSESAIKFHVRRILDAAGAGNRTELARKATQQGWL